MNKETFDKIKDFFDSNDWKYEDDETKGIILSGVNYKNVIGKVKLAITVEETYYKVYVILNNIAEKEYMYKVAEFLHRANYGLNNGNFEMDFDDGEIRYKTYVRTENLDLDKNTVERSILTGLAMVDKYGSGLLKTMLGEDTPEKCIKECEDSESIENS